MKNARTLLLTAAAAVLALGTSTSSASATELAGTEDGAHWYIGSGNAYGMVVWVDYYDDASDADYLILYDDVFPSGYSVRMTVTHDSFEQTVRATHGGSAVMHIPGFTSGEKAKVKACAWDNGDEVMCRPTITITE